MQLWSTLGVLLLCHVFASSADDTDYVKKDCDDNCVDVHRWCGDLEAGSEPQPMNDRDSEVLDKYDFSCDEPFYQLRCPKTCNQCTPCEYNYLQSWLEHLSAIVESLEQRTAPVKAEPRVIGGAQESAYQVEWQYPRLYDGLESSDEYQNQCFVSGTATNAWVEMYLDREYIIDHVEMLNTMRAPNRAITTEVLICTGKLGEDCVSCGTVGQNNASAWLPISCPEDTAGSTIRFTNAADHLTICEVDIDAYLMPGDNVVSYFDSFTEADPTIIGGDESGHWSTWTYTNLYDGIVDTDVHNNGCWVSLSYTDPWVEVYLDQEYTFDTVLILNDLTDPNRALSMEIWVCTGTHGEGCTSCGVLNRGEASTWLPINCPNDTKGDVVRFTNTIVEHLDICEVDFVAYTS